MSDRQSTAFRIQAHLIAEAMHPHRDAGFFRQQINGKWNRGYNIRTQLARLDSLQKQPRRTITDTNTAVYTRYLRARLSPHRLAHSQGVAGVLLELAPIYGLDPAQAAAAGLLHDAAKELAGAEQARWLQAVGIRGEPGGENDYSIYSHGAAGAALVEAELGVRDPLVLGAITTHTFWGNGAFYHHPLTWCLRFGDLLEPNRGWHDRPWLRDRLYRLRSLVYDGKMEAAALLQTGWVIRLFEEIGVTVHGNLRQVIAELRERVPVGDDFWIAE